MRILNVFRTMCFYFNHIPLSPFFVLYSIGVLRGLEVSLYIIYVCLKGIQASFPFYEFQEFMQNNYNPLELLESKTPKKIPYAIHQD